MTLVELIVKNIRRNIKDYGLYIGATVFSIIIYFTFTILKYSEDISSLMDTSMKIKGIMSASAVVLIVFAMTFILYSNTFFIKKRKKEVALYSLLGLKKSKIGFMLFFENMMIGLISLTIGLVLGFFLSQLFLVILLRLMGIQGVFKFAFSIKAIVETTTIFFIIFLITSLIGYRIIYKFKLIDLFRAGNKGEVQPKTGLINVLIGILSLSAAYWIALEDILTSKVWKKFMISTPLLIIGLTIIGSYFLFNNVLVYILNKMKKKERWAWKGLNLMTTSQLLYRIRGNAKTLTIITILSATTITAGGAVFGMYYTTGKNVEQYAPFSFMWEGSQNEIPVELIDSSINFDVKTARVNNKGLDMEYNVINESTFEQLAQTLKWEDVEQIKNKETEALLIEPLYDERWSEKKESIEINDNSYKINKTYMQPIFNIEILPGSVVVLNDEKFEELNLESINFNVIQLDDYRKYNELTKELVDSIDTENFSSALINYQESLKNSGAILFAGSFLGLVFLLATGSIIFFKMLTEAEEDKSKYGILYQIGVAKQDIKRTISYQMGLVFIGPLFLGLMHGSVALIAFSNLLNMNLFKPVLLWMFAYVFIYIIYYFITVKEFYQIIIQEGN